MRVFSPLKPDHPMIGTKCPICWQEFVPHQRVMLVPARDEVSATVPAIAVHANCALEGWRIPGKDAIIVQIKEGDASPYPVVAKRSDGVVTQFTLEECGLC